MAEEARVADAAAAMLVNDLARLITYVAQLNLVADLEAAISLFPQPCSARWATADAAGCCGGVSRIDASSDAPPSSLTRRPWATQCGSARGFPPVGS